MLVAVLLLSSFAVLFALPSEFHQKGFKTFHVVPAVADYAHADLACRSFGGSLVAVRDRHENNLIEGAINQIMHYQNANATQIWKTSTRVWLGSSDLKNWDDGTQIAYKNWAPNEPVKVNWNFCLAMDVKTGKWVSEPCRIQVPFVCQGWVQPC